MNNRLQDIADELGVELDETDFDFEDDVDQQDGVQMQTKEATVIKPFDNGDGLVKDETYNYVLENGDQASITVKHRPKCPSCGHVLAESDEPNQLAGECTECGVQTCHRNQSVCESCEQVYCPQHASGHGLKDSAYCTDCVQDIREDIRFDREMDERQQNHKEKIEVMDKELEQEIRKKKMQLKKIKQEKEEERKDYKTILELLNQVQELKQMRDSDNGGNREGGKPFGGTGAFDGNITNHNEDQDEGSSVPDWFPEPK